MNKILLFMSLLIAPVATFAQKDSIVAWNKWCSHKDTLLLFATANNVIMIHSPTLKADQIKVKSLDMGLRIGIPEIKNDTLSLVAMPFPSKSKNLRLAITNAKTRKVIKTLNFTSDSLPKPVARLGNIKTDEAVRSHMLSQLTLHVEFPKSYYSYPYQIKQFTFKISTPKSSASINVNGFFISKEIQQQISDAPLNTVVEFTNIKATCPECIVRDLDGFGLKIK